MNKKYYVIIISLLIASNLITLLLWSEISEDYHIQTKELDKGIKDVYSIRGQNDTWRVDDTSLILSNKGLTVNGGTLTYIGDASLKDISLYSVDIFYKDNSKEEILLSKSVSSNVAMKFDKQDTISLGSIRSPLLTSDNYNFNRENSIYILFEYFDSQNNHVSDKIKVNITSLVPKDFFKK